MTHSLKPHSITAILLFLTVITGYLVMALYYPMAYIFATYEDLIGEWTQVLLFFSVMVLSLRIASTRKIFRFFFFLLALASFYTFMEEISWGQRLFDIQTPTFFKQHNLQQETNLHNFITGPYATQLKMATEYLLCAGLIGYGLIYPLLLKGKRSLARAIEKIGIPSPPLYLSPFFVVSGLLELGPLRFNEAEIAEILIPMGLMIFLSHHLFLADNMPSPEMQKRNYRKPAWFITAISLFTLVSAAGITYASYSNPRLKKKIDSRIDNGIEKFAGRYKRVGLWKNAVDLYHRIDEKEPNRPSVQRNLSLCYTGLGNTEKADFYITNAISINEKRLARKPSSVSANNSMALTYRQLKDQEKEQLYLDNALANSKRRVEKKPNSANAAYWLGKTYTIKKEYKNALEQYSRALELKPNQKKYLKAVLKAKESLGRDQT